ncbi:MAG: DUF4381 domain-containing protein [Gammaproteobacteria bacterium]|nr:DUF4381 domain-containing protein [Gammaproteobacteria bacterium]
MDQLPLRDLHLPESIGWWPPAVGWWLVLGLLILMGIGAFLLIQRHRRATPLKRAFEALTELESRTDMKAEERLQSISAIIKRFAMSIAPREEVAGLSGDAFFEWIKARINDQSFSSSRLELLRTSPYQRISEDLDLDVLMTDCRQLLTALQKNQRRTSFWQRAGQSFKPRMDLPPP